MRLLRLLAPTAGLAAVLAAPAHAADWKAEGLLTPVDQTTITLDAAVDAAGNSVFVWDPMQQGGEFSYRARPRGGPLGDPAVIPSRAGQAPAVAGSLNGDVVTAWTERRDEQRFNHPIVKASVRTAGGGFGDPQTVFDGGPDGTVCWTTTGIAPNGEAILAFGAAAATPDHSPAPCRPYAAVRAPGAAGFGEPVLLADTPADYLPSVELDAEGNGLIAFRGEQTTAVQVVRHPAGGGFTPPQSVAVAGEVVPRHQGRTILRVSQETGRAILGFPSQVDENRVHVAAAIGSTREGFPSAADVLSGPADLSSGQLGPYFDGAAGEDGTLALTWRSSGRGRTRAQAAYAEPADTRLTTRDTQSLSGYSIQVPRLTVTPSGRVTAMWLRLLGNGRRAVEAASAAPGERFARAQRLTGGEVMPRPNPVIESNSRGEQFIAWNRSDALARADYSVIESAKASSRTGRFGRTLDVLRARTRIGERAREFDLHRSANGAMLATVKRSRLETGSGGMFWDLRSYGER